MENNPDMESFERFIKQQSDDFRMYPTKRVWYSLYNNLHPGRKWPSISMCIVLLTALFLIGFLNTNSNHNSIATGEITRNIDVAANTNSNASDRDKIISIQNSKAAVDNYAGTPTIASNPTGAENNHTQQPGISKQLQSTILAAALQQPKTSAASTKNHGNSKDLSMVPATREVIALLQSDPIIINESIVSGVAERTAVPIAILEEETAETKTPTSASNNAGTVAENLLDDSKKVPATEINITSSRTAETATGGVSIDEHLLSKTTLAESDAVANNNAVTNLTDKSWIENYALYNKPAPRKWKGKMAWQAYFTPSVSYRKLFNNAAGKNIGNLGAGVIGSTDVTLSKEVTQSASMGLEGGISLQYPVFKGVKIKGGFQLNYTRYNIAAFENSHPSITSLEMLSEVNGKPYELYKTTAYSNNAGLIPVTLHSQTFQLSLPVGADIKLAGNDLFEWYAGATIQPTFVFAASSYLISTDRRNYVKDNSMLNHFNMNAAIETFISFKSAGGLTWQIGPQFRKQLYTTSSKFYTVEERLMGYGLKIGFVKKL